MTAKIWGPPNGRPVLALHGWLDNCGTFDALIPLLPSDLRIVAVDMPGHGLSQSFPPDINYNFLDSVVAIERFARRFKWEKFSLLSHSVGAAMAMLYAGLFPEKVDKLVNIDLVRVLVTRTETIDVKFRKTVHKLLKYEQAILEGPEKPISYETAVKRCIEGSFGSLNEKACQILFKRGLKKVDGGYAFSRDRRLLAAALAFAPKTDQIVLAQKVTADVLIIKFTSGPYFEPVEDYLQHIEALKTSSKCVRYVEFSGGHHTHLTHPEKIAPIISEFFNS